MFDFGPAPIVSNVPLTVPACYFGDGRLNELYGGDCAAPVVSYCHAWGITIYRINPATSEGYLIIDMTNEQIEAIGVSSERNVTLAQDDNVIFSRLTTGEFQINAYYADGKPYAMLWDDCPASYAIRITG